MIKAKQILCTGWHKSAVRGGKTNFLKKFIGVSAKKY